VEGRGEHGAGDFAECALGDLLPFTDAGAFPSLPRVHRRIWKLPVKCMPTTTLSTTVSSSCVLSTSASSVSATSVAVGPALVATPSGGERIHCCRSWRRVLCHQRVAELFAPFEHHGIRQGVGVAGVQQCGCDVGRVVGELQAPTAHRRRSLTLQCPSAPQNLINGRIVQIVGDYWPTDSGRRLPDYRLSSLRPNRHWHDYDYPSLG
jgi:hypothetical protein